MATKKKKSNAAGRHRRRTTIRLDRKFYPLAAVKKAREAFSSLAQIEICKEGHSHVVHFSGMSSPIADRLPDEFGNYALAYSMVAE